jgi:hypothetical protein
MPKPHHLVIAALLLTMPASTPAKSGGKSVDRLTAQACAQERKQIGRRAFLRKYGERAPARACARRTRSKVRTALRDASSECLAELVELGPAEFAGDYGSDETGSDAFEQCVDETAEWLFEPGDDNSEEDEEE